MDDSFLSFSRHVQNTQTPYSQICVSFYLDEKKGECPRCGFDLWKGDLVVNDPGFAQDCLACPTCATTYTLQSGQAGPPLKRQGLAALVGNLAKTATADQAERNAKAFAVTRDQETSQVFLREK